MLPFYGILDLEKFSVMLNQIALGSELELYLLYGLVITC